MFHEENNSNSVEENNRVPVEENNRVPVEENNNESNEENNSNSVEENNNESIEENNRVPIEENINKAAEYLQYMMNGKKLLENYDDHDGDVNEPEDIEREFSGFGDDPEQTLLGPMGFQRTLSVPMAVGNNPERTLSGLSGPMGFDNDHEEYSGFGDNKSLKELFQTVNESNDDDDDENEEAIKDEEAIKGLPGFNELIRKRINDQEVLAFFSLDDDRREGGIAALPLLGNSNNFNSEFILNPNEEMSKESQRLEHRRDNELSDNESNNSQLLSIELRPEN